MTPALGGYNMIDNSIFNSIKKLVGPSEYCGDAFDDEILFSINTAIAELTQIGVGPTEGFEVTGPDETWDEFIGTDDPRFAFAKGYVRYSVQLEFDPPANTSVVEAMKAKKDEFLWRCEVRVNNEDL